MAIREIVAGIIAGPAGRVVEAPVRDIVHEVLRQHNLARPEDLHRVNSDVSELRGEVQSLQGKVDALLGKLEALTAKPAAKAAPKPAAKAAPKPAAKAAPKPAAKKAAPKPAAKKAAPKKAAKKAAPKKAAKKAAAKKADSKRQRGRPSLSHLNCTIRGCNLTHRSKGFCSKHYQAWRRNQLKGYVGPKGVIIHGKSTLQVEPKLSGKPMKVTGKGASVKVTVAGEAVDHS